MLIVDSYAKIFLIFYPPLENSTTRTAIPKGESKFNRVFDWTKSMLITISPEFGSYNLKMHQKRNQKCDKNKKLPSFECINSFLASKSPCKISWLNDVTAKNECSEQQMKQHFELAFNIMMGNGSYMIGMAKQVVEFSNGGYKIRKIFA